MAMMTAAEQDDTIETADDDAETTADDHTLDDGPVETADAVARAASESTTQRELRTCTRTITMNEI